jgi:hypothetical protein
MDTALGWISMRHNQLIDDALMQEFYGLDRETLSVDSVSITKSGRLHRWTESRGYVCAQLSGQNLSAEITRQFGLIHLVAVQPEASVALRRQVIRALVNTAQLLKGE